MGYVNPLEGITVYLYTVATPNVSRSRTRFFAAIRTNPGLGLRRGLAFFAKMGLFFLNGWAKMGKLKKFKIQDDGVILHACKHIYYKCLHVKPGIMNRTVPTDIYWISIQSSISSMGWWVRLSSSTIVRNCHIDPNSVSFGRSVGRSIQYQHNLDICVTWSLP